MGSDSTVTVFSFLVFDGSVENKRQPGFKATREVIERDFAGFVLEGTAEQIDASELDHRGCYQRVVTGWGGFS